MKTLIAAVGAATLMFAPVAHAADAALEKPIHAFVDGFNKGDIKAAKATHITAPTITDEVSPHHWSGPKAFDTWLADLGKDAKLTGKTDQAVSITAPTREVIDGATAYVIVPASYTYKQKGVAMREDAQFTYVLHKSAEGWKITAWTWTGPDPKAAQ